MAEQREQQIVEEPVNVYVCGPTVYDSSHLGHARTYVTTDMIVRAMRRQKPVILTMNITDIDDKIINRAQELSSEKTVTWQTVAKTNEESFFEMMSKLNVLKPDQVVRVSESLPSIISYIQKIIDNGFAYLGKDSSIYFDSQAYEKSGYSIPALNPNDYEPEVTERPIKKDPRDFVLWKARFLAEIGFPSEFTINGETINIHGRPGWHIECSAMIRDKIGSQLDVHLGGIDLKFPHHTNERLQAHAHYHPQFQDSSPWCDRFMHIGHLCIKGMKMSKSLKNFTAIEEALKSVSPNQMRLMFAAHTWNKDMDFGPENIEMAQNTDRTIRNYLNAVHSLMEEDEIEEAESEKFSGWMDRLESEVGEFKFSAFILSVEELLTQLNPLISSSQELPQVKWVTKRLFALLSDLGFDYSFDSNPLRHDLMKVLIQTRTELRLLTKTLDKESKKAMYRILDTMRDISLPKIGIQLVDGDGTSAYYPKPRS